MVCNTNAGCGRSLSDPRMLFPKHEDVDRIWGQIARSIAYGPLKEAGVQTAKVAPTSGEDVRYVFR